MRRDRFAAALVLACLAMLAGCGESGPDKALLEPALDDGKTDVTQSVTVIGELGWGEQGALANSFVQDLEFHGYTVAVRAGAEVRLEITQKGSSKSLDTSLFLYGPRTAAGGFGTAALARDDDSGWGRLSKLGSVTLATEGTYLVVVGTDDGLGRGNYRLMASCLSGDCAPIVTPAEQGQCYPSFLLAIEQCVNDQMDSDPEWFYTTTRRNIMEQCADIEVVASAYDQLCSGAQAVESICGQSLDSLNQTQLPVCLKEAWNRELDGLCVFGERYRDITESGALIVLGRNELTLSSPLSDVESAQVLEAVKASAYSDVATAQEAFQAVDGGVVNQTQLWDGSNRKAYTAYEFGAGDNSYGKIFPLGELQAAATIQDGDLYGCTTFWGPELRDCAASSDCADGLTCVGITEAVHRGRCIDTQAAEPALDSSCTYEQGCPAGSGLQCQLAREPGDEGICRPAWMTGHFSTNPGNAVIPDNSADGVAVPLVAYGLATVDVDIRIDLLISHPHISDLLVQLENAAGTRVTLFDHASGGPELYLRNALVSGFSGDESVNGTWRLIVSDTQSGSTGTIGEFGLTITSRWD